MARVRTVLSENLVVTSRQTLSLSGEKVKILSIGHENGNMVLWYETTAKLCEISASSPKTTVNVYMAKTGSENNNIFDCAYIGTVSVGNSNDVRHVYVFGAGLR